MGLQKEPQERDRQAQATVSSLCQKQRLVKRGNGTNKPRSTTETQQISYCINYTDTASPTFCCAAWLSHGKQTNHTTETSGVAYEPFFYFSYANLNFNCNV